MYSYIITTFLIIFQLDESSITPKLKQKHHTDLIRSQLSTERHWSKIQVSGVVGNQIQIPPLAWMIVSVFSKIPHRTNRYNNPTPISRFCHEALPLQIKYFRMKNLGIGFKDGATKGQHKKRSNV
jgi:hypothetical protein